MNQAKLKSFDSSKPLEINGIPLPMLEATGSTREVLDSLPSQSLPSQAPTLQQYPMQQDQQQQEPSQQQQQSACSNCNNTNNSSNRINSNHIFNIKDSFNNHHHRNFQ